MTGSFSSRKKAKDRFHALDYQVMKHVFEIHNRMGNCHDEAVYQNELLHLLQKDGIQAQREVPLSIKFRSYKKTYFLDLLIEDEHIYELKALSRLTCQCKGQIINYQLIAEKPYGKLVNFGGNSVESEFCTSTLTKTDRQNFEVGRTEWNEATDLNLCFYTLAHELISSWGTRLDPELYSEALLALLPNAHETKTEILSDGRLVGSKLVRLAKPDIAFKITTSKKPDPLGIQFQKFINHTCLESLLWINLNNNQITFRTLKKK